MGGSHGHTANREKMTTMKRLARFVGGLVLALLLCRVNAQQSQTKVSVAANERGARAIIPDTVSKKVRDGLDAEFVRRMSADTTVRERNYFRLDPQAIRERADRIVSGLLTKGNAVGGDSARELMVLTRANGERITVMVDSEVLMEGRTAYLLAVYPPNTRIYRCYLKEDRRVSFNVEVLETRIRFNGWIAVPNRQPGSNLALRLGLVEGDIHRLAERELPRYDGGY